MVVTCGIYKFSLSQECVLVAAKQGHLNIIKWIIFDGGLLQNPELLIINAKQKNHIQIIEWAIQNGYPH
jgi:hypothetical protein